jgi:hypothetical protein
VEGMPSWAVYGVPALIWIVALINWLKETAGLDSKWALPVATGLGAVIGTALFFADQYPVVGTVTEIVIGALLIGLAASGYYSGTRAQVERNR